LGGQGTENALARQAGRIMEETSAIGAMGTRQGGSESGQLRAAPVNAGGMAEEAPEAAGFPGCLERSDRAWTGVLANPAAP